MPERAAVFILVTAAFFVGKIGTDIIFCRANNISTKQLLFKGLDKKVHVLASLAEGFV
jgi:hypothetical protein